MRFRANQQKMNKTVNINLANRLFHIDEGAYLKMQRYLESVKRSFANTTGSDEILADIEARIAELFYEKLENERQVITQKEVDEVITIMGQPEDYLVDEDIFEDEPQPTKAQKEPKRPKKLYRDTDQKYVAGVSSGLAHYFKIDALWIRLLWIILTIASGGSFILVYGLLWLLIPEAVTTSQKLDMRGEDINISNIERKVKEGFDDVAQKIKNVDYEGVGNKVKSSGKTFFDSIGDLILFIFKIIGKFIGILLIIIGASTIIGLFIGMVTVGIADAVHIPGLDFYHIVDASNMPIWFVSLLGFFAIGIPFFFLLYLGLKILVNNLKSIGRIAKFSLLGLWLISIILLIVFGVRQATARAYTEAVKVEENLVFQDLSDTLQINIDSYDRAYRNMRTVKMGDGSILSRNEAGEEVIVLDDIDFYIERSRDSVAHIEIIKESNGSSFDKAEALANAINYEYTLDKNTLLLNDFSTTARKNKVMDQEVRVNLRLPVGTILQFNNTSEYRCRRFHFNNDRNLEGCDLQNLTWKVGSDGDLICQDCPELQEEEESETNNIKIDDKGIDINVNENSESFRLTIDENGIDIKANENRDQKNNTKPVNEGNKRVEDQEGSNDSID
ncbi:hypothetical protein LCGC14_0992000 [marine sediment metagenome]